MSLISRKTLSETQARLGTVWTWLATRIERERRLPIAVTAGIILLLPVTPWHSWIRAAWGFYKANKDTLTPLLPPLGVILVGLGSFVVGVGTMLVSRGQARTAEISAEIANRQAQTAAQQAETAAKQAQIADRQAVTTAFHNAVSRLASDKIEERLGGIYILERIARDSLDDHLTVVEMLTAFVRERAKRKDEEAAVVTLEASGPRPLRALGTDIAAVLTVLQRRPEAGRTREREQGWMPDLRGIDLRDTGLTATNFAGIDLRWTHFEGASLIVAHFEHADLRRAQLERADLRGAHLDGANLGGHGSMAPTSAGRTSWGRNSMAPSLWGHSSKAPTSGRRGSKAPTSARRVSKTLTSAGRSSDSPTSARRVWTAPY
jgi:uncharacterized protein YjbI with pentapeptide repeats